MTERPWALFSVAAIFAAGAAVARALAARHPAAYAVDFAQPLVVVTAWGRYGSLCFAVLGVTVLCAALALFAAVRGGGAPARPALPVAAAATSALAAAAAWPFVFSSDVYAYAAYGALAAHGVDPYALAPRELHEPFAAAARWQWGGDAFPACIYGPVFVALARLVVVVTGGTHVAPALVGLRLLACGSFVGCIFALDAALCGVARRARFTTLAIVGLNPVALWSVAEGHNDAVVLLAAILGFVLIRRGSSVTGALLIGLTPLVKATGTAFAAGLAIDLFAFTPPGWKRPLAALGLAYAAAIAVALLAALPALQAVRLTGRYAPAASVQGAVGVVPVIAIVFATAAYGIVRLRARERDGHAWLGIAVWLALPNPYPWYVLWLLPAVALAGTGAAAAGLYGVTISSVVRYLPDAFGHIDSVGLRSAAAVEALPLLLALALLVRPFQRRKTTFLT